MKTSIYGNNFIKGFERLELVPYICSGGWWTIGYGHAISKADKPTSNSYSSQKWSITEEQANELLAKDLATSERAISRLVRVALNQNQFDALSSFTFNLGSGALQASTLRAKINRGEFDSAAYEFDRWVLAGGRRLLGLVRRRRAERILFQS
jgi:lysozyme